MPFGKDWKGGDPREDVYGGVGHADGSEGCGESLRGQQ
jgi:hypothetical protein